MPARLCFSEAKQTVLTERAYARKAEAEQPGGDYETPMRTWFISFGWEMGQEDGTDNICCVHADTICDDDEATANLVDREHYHKLTKKTNHCVDGSVAKSVDSVDADLFL